MQFWPKVEYRNWETIFYEHYRSIFNHCDIMGLQSYQIRWKKRKTKPITPFKVIQAHWGRYQSVYAHEEPLASLDKRWRQNKNEWINKNWSSCMKCFTFISYIYIVNIIFLIVIVVSLVFGYQHVCIQCIALCIQQSVSSCRLGCADNER